MECKMAYQTLTDPVKRRRAQATAQVTCCWCMVPGRLTRFALQLFALSEAHSAESTGCHSIAALQAEMQTRPWCKTPS